MRFDAHIGSDVKLGQGVRISSFCHISNTSIGDKSIIHPNCTIGTVPFFYRYIPGNFLPVNIGENVVIHTGTNINAGVEGKTVIGNDVKIDSHCHIAHDCKIGRGTIIAAGTVMGGFVEIGKNCRIGLNVTIKNRVKIADDTIIGMGAIITHDISGRIITKPNYCSKKITNKLEALRGDE